MLDARAFLATLCLLAAGELHAAPQPCDALAQLRLPDTTITVSATTSDVFTTPDGTALKGLPTFCRVGGVIRPTSESHIEFEVWMPASGWNGKFYGLGNGGFAGAIPYDQLAQAVARGYAVAGTDTGHRGSAIDTAWAFGHPEKVTDFGHRAIHEMTVKAKAVVSAFYGNQPRRSYFASCSNGGRQGLMEAQRYPDDYDGIVAGAPAAAWTRFLAAFAWNTRALLRPGAHIPPNKLPLIERAVVAACDQRDGVADGVLVTPDSCRFDPRSLVCQGVDADTCLTSTQAEAVAAIYQGARTSDGRQLARGYPMGAETGDGGWVRWLTGPAPGKTMQTAMLQGTLANILYQRKDYDLRTFDLEREASLVDTRLGPTMNATNPDLSAFHKRGGKLILFHGWNDPGLSVYETIDYFEAVRARMDNATDGFARLYLVPGLQHCTGGPGATYIGGMNVPFRGAGQDISAALERWVEEGEAPGPIVATAAPDRANYSAPPPPTPRRLVCPYPQVPVYRGSANADDVKAWTCRAR